MHRPEQVIQIQLVNILKLSEPEVLAFHVANGGWRATREAQILKAMGVRAGIPDLVVCWPVGRTGFIELKAHNGAMTNFQTMMNRRLRDMGFPVAVARSVEHALIILDEWGVPLKAKVEA